MSYTLNLLDHYAGVRSRLYGVPAVVALALPALYMAPVPLGLAPPDDDADDHPHGAPMNMLGGCSWRFLLALAAAKHGLHRRDILSDSRSVKIVAARHYAIALIYQHTQGSLPKVGRIFGLHHSTVLHALRKFDACSKLVEVVPS